MTETTEIRKTILIPRPENGMEGMTSNKKEKFKQHSIIPKTKTILEYFKKGSTARGEQYSESNTNTNLPGESQTQTQPDLESQPETKDMVYTEAKPNQAQAEAKKKAKPNQNRTEAKYANIKSVGVGMRKRHSAIIPFRFKPVNEHFLAQPRGMECESESGSNNRKCGRKCEENPQRKSDLPSPSLTSDVITIEKGYTYPKHV